MKSYYDRYFFKKDKNGATLFYPYSWWFGKGRILPETTEKEIRKFLHIYFHINAGAAFLFYCFGSNLSIYMVLYLLVMAVSLALIKSRWLTSLCSEFPCSEEKLTFAEVQTGMVTSCPEIILWLDLLAILGFLVFVLFSFFKLIVITDRLSYETFFLVGIFLCGIIGGSAAFFGYLIFLKRNLHKR